MAISIFSFAKTLILNEKPTPTNTFKPNFPKWKDGKNLKFLTKTIKKPLWKNANFSTLWSRCFYSLERQDRLLRKAFLLSGTYWNTFSWPIFLKWKDEENSYLEKCNIFDIFSESVFLKSRKAFLFYIEHTKTLFSALISPNENK